MTVDTSTPRSRRALLGAAVGAAAAAAAAAAIPASVAGADPNDVVLGADNAAMTRTKISASVVGQGHAAIVGSNASTAGTGVLGEGGPMGGAGVYGSSPMGIGVKAEGGVTGVLATGGTDGVRGSGGSVGVRGENGQFGVIGAGNSAGVQGLASDDTGVGVHGKVQADPNFMTYPSQAGVGVLAEASDPAFTALHVLGRVRFSSSGRASMSSTQASKVVTKAGVTSSSYIVATLNTAVAGVFVRAVVPGAGKLTIYLSKAAGKTVNIAYLVIN